MRFSRHLSLVAALLCACAPLSFADQVVYFVNGKAIMARSVEKGEKFTILEMDGGGRIGVPTDQISRIEEYTVTAPVEAAPAPLQVTAVPAAAAPAAPAPAARAGAPLPPPGMLPGPGMGGRPAGLPGQNIAGIQPLDIGGSGAAPAPQRPNPRVGAGNRGAGGPMLAGGAPGAGRPSLGAGRRPGGRTSMYGSARGAGRLAEMTRNSPPAVSPVAPAPDTAAPPVASQPEPAPTTAGGPEEPPPPPDDSNEEPSETSAPEEGDSSGNTAGGPS